MGSHISTTPKLMEAERHNPDYSRWSPVESDSENWSQDSLSAFECLPDETILESEPENKSPYDEVPKSIAGLMRGFPEFRSQTVLFMEQKGFPKSIAFMTLEYLTPNKVGDLITMRLWESAANSIADTGFFELLQHLLMDMDFYHTKRIDNTRNLNKACEDHDIELLKIIIKKYQAREHVAMYFDQNGGGNPMPSREQGEFTNMMRRGMEKAAETGFLDGVMEIHRWYFGPYDTIIGKALDSGHEDIVKFLISPTR